jgi:isopenicillin-N N-acyltransferase like protein
MRKPTSRWRIAGYVLATVIGLFLIGFAYLYSVALTYPPIPTDSRSLHIERQEPSKGLYALQNGWFRKSNSGLFEMYVEGSPFEMGFMNGKLSKELVMRQEDYFNEQIRKMIPSEFYLNFLKYFIGWFNRDLDDNVTDEYKQEISGISKSASDKYEYIGSNYQRILNYHAAHDIGHALQSMALVGCTSFGTWGEKSENGTMVIGRNFDFYVGDKFAEDKIVAFFAPTKGHKFMTVTWGGFVGAVSGMNDAGLTVTINAAKSDIPAGSATPVSLVAREILQYAHNIGEAISIAKNRKMFVSESFLVASAADKRAVVIEKTPDSLDVYDPNQGFIACANHFQSKGLGLSKSNLEQLKNSASAYRYQRLQELLSQTKKNSVEKTIQILRNQQGLQNADIGMGNEKAINQLIAHHSVVFEPENQLVWVSTSPYQLGQFVCYDLKKVFGLRGLKQNQEICEAKRNIAADSFLLTKNYKNFVLFRKYKQQILDGKTVDIDSLLACNPNYYDTYRLAGDVALKNKQPEQAKKYYETALTKTIATKNEEESIRKKLNF